MVPAWDGRVWVLCPVEFTGVDRQMIGLRGITAVLVLAVPVVAAPVPAPIQDESVSATANRMLQHETVRDELKLSSQQRTAIANLSADTSAARLLTPAQRSRLRQLERQVLGPGAYADPDVQKTLRLTDSQKSLAADLTMHLDRRVTDYLAIFGNDDADNMKSELLAFRQSAMKHLDSTFTDIQRTLWKGLLGEPATAFDPDLHWLYVLVEERLRSR